MLQSAAQESNDLRLKSILVPTDLSSASDRAFRHAVSIARHHGATLHVVHVTSSRGSSSQAGEDAGAQAGVTATEAEALERRLAASGAIDGIPHDVTVCRGNLRQELEAAVDRIAVDLAVIGTHAPTGVKKLVFGSLAERILRRAECPVLTVGPRSPADVPTTTGGAVLFSTDLSPASLAALPHAVSTAKRMRMLLAVLHIVSPSDLHVDNCHWVTATGVVDMEREAVIDARRRLERWTLHRIPDVSTATIVQFGEPAREIVRVARALRARVIFMGLKPTAHIDASSHLASTVAYDVVCAAGCPVLTVREGAAIDGARFC